MLVPKNFPIFLEEFIDVKNGDVVYVNNDTRLKLNMQHKGVAFYTIGQRIPYIEKPFHLDKLYVIDKDIINNVLFVGKYNHYKLFSTCVYVHITQWHWLSESHKHSFLNSVNKCVLWQGFSRCRLPQDLIQTKVSFAMYSEWVKFQMDKPVRAPTVGQFVVFYDDNICVGSGPIAKTVK
ncbi:tRNA (5-methylaminomethyl-2-thiouridylate)-methyltransferase [Reticulomyxa filosa]|uniref:tRNA (5-methylaminomethyl-2-thiouridylate)-methyltransferase n=1 Tax=Reticulomyxa filosa TaxID=46433 RepID=X6LP35_RETFI|nr:tRNA (5-methylaminomethyl-2-thiouridylate)-methyltransferase [Reticulomyxa filosa]|eukprot:ETO03359.1 tRNA (5-methylaminomethyl-2-thiouridylate)-methyltransferase [Reticulomyxa filosa]